MVKKYTKKKPCTSKFVTKDTFELVFGMTYPKEYVKFRHIPINGGDRKINGKITY